MEKEEWKDIDGFPKYQVSSLGRVRHWRWNKWNILKPIEHPSGYLSVSLYDDNGKEKSMRINRLVAMAFIPNPENKPEVNHINEIKSDNRVVNLNWMTSKENSNWGTGKERQRSKLKGRPLSEETKRKLSLVRKGKPTPWMVGREVSDEIRNKLSVKNQSLRWYNNGEVTIFSRVCPEGFVPGRLPFR